MMGKPTVGRGHPTQGSVIRIGKDLIAEVAHVIEMGSNAADIGLTVHPHSTLSETVAMAAEMFEASGGLLSSMGSLQTLFWSTGVHFYS